MKKIVHKCLVLLLSVVAIGTQAQNTTLPAQPELLPGTPATQAISLKLRSAKSLVPVGKPPVQTPQNVKKTTEASTESEWEDMGMATYRDDLTTACFDILPQTYEVPIQKSTTIEGLYRLVNPYGSTSPYSTAESYTFDTSRDYYMTIHAEDPEKVWIELEASGMSLGYGMLTYGSEVAYLINNGSTLDEIKATQPELFGTLENGVITMPAHHMLASMGEVYGSYFILTNLDGLFGVALPGYQLNETYVRASLSDIKETRKGTKVIAHIKKGTDIENVNVALVKSTDISSNTKLQAIIEALANGTHENFATLTTGNTVYLDASNTPDKPCQILAVGTGKHGTAEGKSIIFSLPQWEAIGEGTFEYSILFDNPLSSTYTLYRSSNDPARYMIKDWFNIMEGTEEAGDNFTFTKHEDGICVVDNMNTGVFIDVYNNYLRCTDITYYYANEKTSRYDAETDTYLFNVIYTIDTGNGIGALGSGTERFVMNDPTVGITDATTGNDAYNKANAPMYDLTGRRVSNGYKGLVIRNGKKLLLK